MNAPSAAETAACRVLDGDRLPASSGGADALCAAIRAASQAPFSVEVQVLSKHSLAARVTLPDGRSLPEQRLDISDRALTQKTFEWFARNLAGEVAKFSGQ